MRRPLLVAAILLTAACGTSTEPSSTATIEPATTSSQTSMQDWYADNSYIIDAISASADDAATAAGNYDTDALATACDHLESAAETGLDADPMPVAAIDVHWQSALRHYATAGRLCQLGADSIDGGLLSEAADEISQGSDDINAATAAVNGDD